MNIDEEFKQELDTMENEEFWILCSAWKDDEVLREEMLDWDEDIKKDVIKEIKDIKERKQQRIYEKFCEDIQCFDNSYLQKIKEVVDTELHLSERAIEEGMEIKK